MFHANIPKHFPILPHKEGEWRPNWMHFVWSEPNAREHITRSRITLCAHKVRFKCGVHGNVLGLRSQMRRRITIKVCQLIRYKVGLCQIRPNVRSIWHEMKPSDHDGGDRSHRRRIWLSSGRKCKQSKRGFVQGNKVNRFQNKEVNATASVSFIEGDSVGGKWTLY